MTALKKSLYRVRPNIFKCMFDVYSKPILNLSTQLYIVQISYVLSPKRGETYSFILYNKNCVRKK